MTSNPTYGQFFNETLTQMALTPTIPARRSLAIISIVEGVNSYWNPMNWVIPTDQGFPNWNNAGVKMYPDWKTGALWTAVNLMENSRWDTFVQLLGSAKSRTPILQEMERIYASWGAHLDLEQFTAADAIARLNLVMQGK